MDDVGYRNWQKLIKIFFFVSKKESVSSEIYFFVCFF